MNSLKDFEQRDGVPYLLLSDKNEYCFQSGIKNWEHFAVNSIIYSSDICVISNSQGHHVCGAGKLMNLVSFIYVPTHCLWVTETFQEGQSETMMGSMKIYSEYALKYKSKSIKDIDIHGVDMLDQRDANDLICHIQSGAVFRLCCTFTNGSKGSFEIDLPMVNEKGEFRFNIKPFFGILDSILNPAKLSDFLNSKISYYNDNKPGQKSGFFENEEVVCDLIKQDRGLMPVFQIRFTQDPDTRFCQPGNIFLVLENNNTVLCFANDRNGVVEYNLRVDIADCRVCVYP